ncbi:MAG: hypothetical protein SXA11_09455 [Cyanobacteriota bacterium]|nr:hypothetical protein [Cyanobacteriota bacterium]
MPKVNICLPTYIAGMKFTHQTCRPRLRVGRRSPLSDRPHPKSRLIL